MKLHWVALSLGMAFPGITLADAIDGDWCAPDRLERVNIAGPTITLSSGTEVTGTYTRHEFLYRVPEGEPNAGIEIFMRQLGEEDADVYRGTAPPERWTRCQAVVS